MTIEKERFEAWLFAQSRARQFNWLDADRCVVSSFLNETCSDKWSSDDRKSMVFGERFETIKVVIWPDWLKNLINPILERTLLPTVAILQGAYLKLFPDTILPSGEVGFIRVPSGASRDSTDAGLTGNNPGTVSVSLPELIEPQELMEREWD